VCPLDSLDSEADEGEPVRRHVAMAANNFGKDVYGVFIAPTIDTNTAETFRVGVWYHNETAQYLKIVPFSLNQFKTIFSGLLEKRYTPDDLKLLIDGCLGGREGCHAPAWKEHIEQEMHKWQRVLVSEDKAFIDQIEHEINKDLEFV